MNIQEEKEKYQKIAQEAENIVLFNEYDRAYEFYNSINDYLEQKELQKNYPDLYKNFCNVMYKMQWMCLFRFGRKEVLSLFHAHFQEGLDLLEYQDFNFWEQLRTFLLGYFPRHEDRDEFKKEIIKILNRSEAQLTSQKIDQETHPTVKNWIKLYTKETGTTGPVETLKFRSFLTENFEVKKLNSQDKQKLEKFLQFYERLKLSSLTASGVEDSIPVNTEDFQGMISDGKIIKFGNLDPRIKDMVDDLLKTEKESPEERNNKKPEENFSTFNLTQKKIEELQQEQGKYSKGSLEYQAIEEEIRKLQLASKKSS